MRTFSQDGPGMGLPINGSFLFGIAFFTIVLLTQDVGGQTGATAGKGCFTVFPLGFLAFCVTPRNTDPDQHSLFTTITQSLTSNFD